MGEALGHAVEWRTPSPAAGHSAQHLAAIHSLRYRPPIAQLPLAKSTLASGTVQHTPLRSAAAVRMLVAAGADPRAVNARGSTILHTAIGNDGWPLALAAMAAAGADIDAIDASGATALDCANFAAPFHRGKLVRIRCLVELGADIGSCGGSALQVVMAKVTARLQRLGGRVPKAGFGGCLGRLSRMRARHMAWPRRRHMLLAVRGRHGVPEAAAAEATVGASSCG